MMMRFMEGGWQLACMTGMGASIMHETPMRGCDYTNKFEGLMLNHVR